MELFQELNQKFQTLDRFRDIPNTSSMVSILCFISAQHHAKDMSCQLSSLPLVAPHCLGKTRVTYTEKNNPSKGTLECTKGQIKNDRIFKYFICISNALRYNHRYKHAFIGIS